MARPARSSTIIKPGFEAAVALESYAASFLRKPALSGVSCLPLGFGLCHFMPRPCIGVRSPGVLLRLLQRATLSARSLNLTGSSIRMQCHDGPHLLYQGIKTFQPWELVACRPKEERTYFPCHQSIIG